MFDRIIQSDLKPADILLYHGTAFLSRLIRLFDGGDYSHASIYDGNKVLEALGDGITENSLAKSVAGAKFVDVYRYVSANGKKLDDPVLPSQPVVDRINYYRAHKERYAYEQILLLAMLAATRRLPFALVPGLGMIIRNVLDDAASVVWRFIALGREPVICSELVYRCYKEAEGKYAILIAGADVSLSIANEPAASPLASVRATEVTHEQAEAIKLQQAATAFLAQYALAKGRGVDDVSGGPGMLMLSPITAAVSDFVTPHDLQRSPSLYRVGTLKI